MALLPGPLAELMAALGTLPGVGPRTAERLALHLVQADLQRVRDLAQALVTARERVRGCERCGALTECQPCLFCADAGRDGGVLCVVERPVDVLLVEKAGGFRGRYHVLGGRLSPMDGIGPEDLNIAALEGRVGSESVREVILALPTDVEGDATSHYLAARLAGRGAVVTRLAHGLPAGTSLDFADELTLSRAIEGRHPFRE
ncbi:MAG TPA: recombination mediator RecR [Verrucomicrobiota bacterium]|nr:recombination mediator RecR [Verrucomicrobiota bacterium]HNU50868.1 recombination mediator RecR [Verrucomicrobiota bacterium]